MAMARWLGWAAAVLLVAGGCDDAERNAEGRLTEPGELSVFQLRAGDCFDGGTVGEELGDVDAVPCDDEHDNEVYALLTHPAPAGEPFPGREQIIAFAEKPCVDAFAAYVGENYGASEFEIALIPPQERSWTEKDDRAIACVLHDAEGRRITGSQQA